MKTTTIGYGSILQMYCVGISDQTEKFEYVMQLPLQILPLLAADFDKLSVSKNKEAA